MASASFEDDLFEESPTTKNQRFFNSPVNKKSNPDSPRSTRSQENSEPERPPVLRRRMSVLDEKALREDDTKLIREQRINTISRNYQSIIESIGEDSSRQGRTSFLSNFILVFKFHRLSSSFRFTQNAETRC